MSTEIISDRERMEQMQQRIWELEQQILSLQVTISNKDDRIEELEEEGAEALMRNVETEVAMNWFDQLKFGKTCRELVQDLFHEHNLLFEEVA